MKNFNVFIVALFMVIGCENVNAQRKEISNHTVNAFAYTGAAVITYSFIGWYADGKLQPKEALFLTGAALVITGIVLNEKRMKQKRIQYSGNGIVINLGRHKVREKYLTVNDKIFKTRHGKFVY